MLNSDVQDHTKLEGTNYKSAFEEYFNLDGKNVKSVASIPLPLLHHCKRISWTESF